MNSLTNLRHSLKKILTVLTMVLFASIFMPSGDVNAGVKSTSDVYKLSIYTAVDKCYDKFALDSLEKIEIDYWYDVFKHTFSQNNDSFDYVSAEHVWVPTYIGTSFASSDNEGQRRKDSNLSCKQVFTGWEEDKGNKAKGILQYFGGLPNKASDMGYVGDATSVEDNVVNVKLNGIMGIDDAAYGGQIKCTVAKDAGTEWYYVDNCKGYVEVNGIQFRHNNKNRAVNVQVGYDENGYASAKITENGNTFTCGGGEDTLTRYYSDLGYGITCDTIRGYLMFDRSSGTLGDEDELVAAFRDSNYTISLKDAITTAACGVLGGCEGPEAELKIESSGTGGVATTLKPLNGDKTTAAHAMLANNIAEELPHTVDDSASMKTVAYNWTSPYTYAMYYYYLSKIGPNNGITIGGSETNDCGDTKESLGLTNGEYAFKNADSSSDDTPAWCKIKFSNDERRDEIFNTKVSLYGGNNQLEFGDMKKIFEWFTEEDSYKGMTAGDYAAMKKGPSGALLLSTAEEEEPTTEDPSATGQTAATCQSSGGAGAVGWIVCPILEWMGSASTHLYTDYVEPKLKINPKLFQVLDNGKNPTRDAWGTFQTIANVVFIILLLVVIFSQLTGVGIDNYGIKRILPKLIIVAILVNLSYLICVICVDLSNILGSSLKGLFDSLGASFDPISVDTGVASTTALGNDSWVPVVLFGILVTYLIVGAVSIVYNPAILLTLLISGLGVVISVLFVFVLFAIREAAIVVLTVVAPIAFVCYTLPNTKKMFDRWLKAWQGLLIVYPICGLLIGGGDYVSRLLLVVESATAGGSSFFQMMTAIVVGIAPVFFIPSLLKGSFAAMGSIGAKVSGFGRSLGGRASSRLQNSNLNKSAQRMGEERRSRIRAGLNKDGELTAGAQRRISRLKRAAGMGGIVGGIAAGRMKAEAANINAAKKNLSASEEASASLTNAMAATGIKSAGGKPIDYYTQQFNEALSRGDKAGMSAALTAAVSSGYMKDKDIAGMVRNAAESGALGEAGSGWMRDTASKFGNGFLATDFEMRHWMQNGGNGNLGGFGEYAKNNINIDDIKPEDLSRLSGDSMAGLAAAGLINQGMAQRVMASNANLSQDKRVMLGAIASGATNARSIQAAGGNSVSDGARMFKEESKALMNTPGAEKVADGDGGSRDFAAIHTVAGSGGQTTWTDPEGVTHDTATTAQVEKWMGPTATPVSLDASGGVAAGAPSATAVAEASGGVGEGGVFNVRENAGAADVSNYTDETLLNVATDPNVDMNDPLRLAAVAEYERREAEKAPLEQWHASKVEANRVASERREARDRVIPVPAEESFEGETNINSRTGKERTYGTFDVQPRMAGESPAKYGARLQHNADLTRQAETNPPAPQMHFYDPYHKEVAEPPKGTPLPTDLRERMKMFPRRPDEKTVAYNARIKSDNPWGN